MDIFDQMILELITGAARQRYPLLPVREAMKRYAIQEAYYAGIEYDRSEKAKREVVKSGAS